MLAMKRIFLFLFFFPVIIHAQIITTVAGNGVFNFGGDGGAAIACELNYPTGVAVDNAGNIYIADAWNNRIRRVDAAGIITTIAGTDTVGYSGDGGAATLAALHYPTGVAVDQYNNVYIADTWNNTIRKINASGIITTIAGNGAGGYTGDGLPATAEELYYPSGLAIDNSGNVFIADVSNQRIRKINAGGIISTVAGVGQYGYGGDGAAATLAGLGSPVGVAVDNAGNVYIADEGDSRIRKVDTAGIISTVAGTDISGYSGDGGPASAAMIYDPYGLAIDNAGNIYFTDAGNSLIRKISASGVINTIAGNDTAGYNGDAIAPTASEINDPYGITIDHLGNIYFADESNSRIRKICMDCTTDSIKQSFLIYPNPAQNELTILSSQPMTSIALIDVWGQIIYTYACNTEQVHLDVTYLAASVYFVRINGTVVRKFVKK